MRAPRRSTRIVDREDGALFVQIVIALFVLMGFSAFVLDSGIMWVARRQAQNAADAAAFAGAVARNYDDFDDPPSPGGPAAEAAEQVAAANPIWQQPGTAAVSFDCPPGVTGRCVQVDVYRNGDFGSTELPTVFGPVLGIVSQGVRATATAQAVNGNTTNCLRPFAFPDEWDDVTPNDQFNRYWESGPSAGELLPPPRDAYFPPSDSQALSTNLFDLGDRINFRLDRPFDDPIMPGFLLPLDLPGSATYQENIRACNGSLVSLRDRMPLAAPPPGGTTYDALQDLFNQDPGATYNFFTHTIGGSCAPTCAPVSPRLIAVALFDPDDYQLRRATNNWSGCPSGNPCIRISNIAAVFIHDLSGGTGHGHFLRYPGLSVATAPTFVDEGSWLVSTTLIR